jgi:RND family efflux transporter MFP subunit
MLRKLFSSSIIVLQAFVLSINTSYSNPYNSKALIETAKVSKTQLFEIFKTVALVENINSKNFFAKAEGTIDIKTDNSGGEIKKGDILLAINYSVAETMKAQAELSYKVTKNKFDKDIKLFKNNVITEDGLNKSKLDFENAKLTLEKTLDEYSKMVIQAPFNGKIGVIKYKIDDNVKVGDFLFTIISPGFREAVVSLPQKLYSSINKASEVYLIDDFKKRHKATITSISPYISKETGNFEIRLELEDNDNFLHGAYADIEIIYNSHDALVIPEASLSRDDKGSYIYLVKDNKTVKKYLQLGIKENGMVEVRNADITLGDEVVTEGLTKIFEGSMVEVKATPSATETGVKE